MNPCKIVTWEQSPDGVNLIIHALDTGRQYAVCVPLDLLGELSELPPIPPPAPVPDPPQAATEDNPAAVGDAEAVQLPDGTVAPVEPVEGASDAEGAEDVSPDPAA